MNFNCGMQRKTDHDAGACITLANALPASPLFIRFPTLLGEHAMHPTATEVVTKTAPSAPVERDCQVQTGSSSSTSSTEGS